MRMPGSFTTPWHKVVSGGPRILPIAPPATVVLLAKPSVELELEGGALVAVGHAADEVVAVLADAVLDALDLGIVGPETGRVVEGTQTGLLVPIGPHFALDRQPAVEGALEGGSSSGRGRRHGHALAAALLAQTASAEEHAVEGEESMHGALDTAAVFVVTRHTLPLQTGTSGLLGLEPSPVSSLGTAEHAAVAAVAGGGGQSSRQPVHSVVGSVYALAVHISASQCCCSGSLQTSFQRCVTATLSGPCSSPRSSSSRSSSSSSSSDL